MARRELVDVQLSESGGRNPIGSRYTSEVDHTNGDDVRGLFRDALTHAGINVSDGSGYEIKVWHHNTGEELFTYTY